VIRGVLAREYVMRDNDAKFSAQFDGVLTSSGAIVKRNTALSPNLWAHVERFIQTLKFECLNKFVIVAEKHSTICAESGVANITKNAHIRRGSTCRRISPRLKNHPEQSVSTTSSALRSSAA